MSQPITLTLAQRAPRPLRWLGILLVLGLLCMPFLALLPASHPLAVPSWLLTLSGKILCYAIVAVALDLVWGYAGMLSLGHGIFFALGGYAMGMYLMRQAAGDGLPAFMSFLSWSELPWFWWGTQHFAGAADKGWVIIPCELIDYNGEALQALVLRYASEWELPQAFITWLTSANTFCSTLVDRIVTGYPRDEVAALEAQTGYKDAFLDTAEHFYLFVIQGPASLEAELRLDKLPLNVRIVDDIKPYKERKVAILNGAHTALVPVAFQAGIDTVGEAMNDSEICAFVEKAIYDEIIPVLDLPRDELVSFASAVTGRFRNPYIKHQLLSIALNGMTKYRTRILPQLLAGQKAHGALPPRLTFALAALIAFYRGERDGESYPVQDDADWISRYQTLWARHRDGQMSTRELVTAVLSVADHWQQDLSQIPGLVELVTADLDAILTCGMRDAVKPLC